MVSLKIGVTNTKTCRRQLVINICI